MKNVIVVFGGKSCEHDISVITGVLTLNTINSTLFNAIPIYIATDGTWYTGKELSDISFYKTKKLKTLKRVSLLSGSNTIYIIRKGKLKPLVNVDCAINCTHGKNGEDGTLAGVFNSSNIALVGSNNFSSSLSMDKEFTKTVMNGLKVSVLPHLLIKKESFYLDKNAVFATAEEKLNFPLIIKPCNLGSSIGITVAHNKEELANGLVTAFKYDVKVILEKYLTSFKEINCACYGVADKIVVSECEEPIKKSKILSFNDKYQSGSVELGVDKKFPAELPLKTSDKIKKITKNVYEKCGFSGIIRVDYLLVDGKVYLNEINSIPGSMAYYLFSDTLSGFSNILTELILDAMVKRRVENSLDYTYFSKVLNFGVGIKGAKRR